MTARCVVCGGPGADGSGCEFCPAVDRATVQPAGKPFELRIVVAVETDGDPELLGAYQSTDEYVVWYTTSDGHYRQAPDDCVRIVTVTV